MSASRETVAARPGSEEATSDFRKRTSGRREPIAWNVKCIILNLHKKSYETEAFTSQLASAFVVTSL